MKGILLLNGAPYTGEINDCGAAVYCCDGAYEWAKGRVRIDKNVGDFDSLPYIPSPPPEEIYPSEKNFTDGEIALFKMLGSGIDDITIYGGGGGREAAFIRCARPRRVRPHDNRKFGHLCRRRQNTPRRIPRRHLFAVTFRRMRSYTG